MIGDYIRLPLDYNMVETLIDKEGNQHIKMPDGEKLSWNDQKIKLELCDPKNFRKNDLVALWYTWSILQRH